MSQKVRKKKNIKEQLKRLRKKIAPGPEEVKMTIVNIPSNEVKRVASTVIQRMLVLVMALAMKEGCAADRCGPVQ